MNDDPVALVGLVTGPLSTAVFAAAAWLTSRIARMERRIDDALALVAGARAEVAALGARVASLEARRVTLPPLTAHD
jgi:hypothetical protein